MSESMGNLVDRLTICNIKLYMTQDKVYAYSRMSQGEFEKVGYEALQKLLQTLGELNLERNRLMVQCDECLAEAVRSGQVRVDARIKLTE